jgi:hypothetical protein
LFRGNGVCESSHRRIELVRQRKTTFRLKTNIIRESYECTVSKYIF